MAAIVVVLCYCLPCRERKEGFMKRFLVLLAAVTLVSCARAEPLVFDVTGDETYSGKIGSTCEKIVKNGTGTLTLTSEEEAAFTGTVEVNAGILKINRIGNLGNPAAIIIAPGATLDLSGSETVLGSQPWCPSLTMGGSGCAGTTGALVRNRGVAWDRMFQNVTLTADTVVDFNADTSFGYGTLALNGHNFTKRGSGQFYLEKWGKVTGDGVIYVEGPTVIQSVDMTEGNPEKNCLVLRATCRWWTTSYTQPIHWKLRCEEGGEIVVGDTTVAGFEAYRLWTGPVESPSGIAFTNNIGSANAAVTYAGDIALGGALTTIGKGALRLTGASIVADALDMRKGNVQIAPPSGTTVAFAKTSQAYGFFDAICGGSTVSFGGDFAARYVNALTRLRGGDYTFGGEVKLGSNGHTNIWDVSDGATVTVSGTFNLGYLITTGHTGVFSVRGEGAEFDVQKYFKFSRTPHTKAIVNISEGAVFAASRLTPTVSAYEPTAECYVNVDGGIIKPTYGYGWTGGSEAKSGYEPPAFTLFEGGMTVDLGECWAENVPGGQDGARVHSSFSMALEKPRDGRRIAAIALPADEAFRAQCYASVPPVVITGCPGASAFLDIDSTTRQPKGIVVTSKGWGLSEDATVTVAGADEKTNYSCEIVPEEMPADGWKGLTVLGASGSALFLQEANTYRGPTTATSGADVRFMVQDGRPIDSGLIVEKGSTIRFNNTDQSARPIPFIQGGGTIQGFSSSITARAIYVKVAELLNGEFMHVNGELVLPADTTVKIVDPENLNAETFGNGRQILSATTLTLPPGGVASFTVDAVTDDGNPWRVKMCGTNGLSLLPPNKALVISVR